jgi:hypothetical protein
MIMKNFPWLAVFAAPLALSAQTKPIVSADVVFQETDGLVAIEAEHFTKQERTEVRAWYIHSTQQAVQLEPDADGSHAGNASGGAYVEILPDTRRDHSEKLVHGENFSDEPGRLAILSYPVNFSTPGRYYVWIRNFSTGSEDNGVHVGFDGTWPESGRRWQTVKKQNWHWDCKQRTKEVHVGVPMQLYLDIPTAAKHTIQFSMREDGFEMDKFVLALDRSYVPEGTGPEPKLVSGTLPKPFPPGAASSEPAPATRLKAAPEANAETVHKPGHAGGTAPAAASGTIAELAAKDLFLEATDFYLDRGKWAAINPDRARSASITSTVPVGNARYHVTLHAVGESDGQSTYELLIGGRMLGKFEVPLSTEMFEEGPQFNHTWTNVEINEGETIEIRAAIASADGKEFARARWSKVTFTPVERDPGTLTAHVAASAKPKQQRAAVLRQPSGDGSVRVTGELKQWHAVTLDLAGPFSHELDDAPNPFTDYAYEVTFTHESGSPSYRVPGYFAADGRAADTHADAGTVWRAHLSPDKTGTWSYAVSFRRGPGAATQGGGEVMTPFDGKRGQFRVAASDKKGRDFRARGRLAYNGTRYLHFTGDGSAFFKAGPDSPETFLAYADFDNTIALKHNVPLKTWQPHAQDWRRGDPTWAEGSGKGIIGAINYLAEKGVNAFSFLTYNAGGDGDNVWPFVERDDKLHYDVSKLAQWDIVFAHAQARGLYLHFKLQENESDDHRAGANRTPKVIPEAMDAGETGPERRLYFREMVARFGHHLALNWNFGEENTQSYEEQIAMFDYVASIDPYGHHRVIHTFPGQQDRVYTSLLGNKSNLTGVSAQNPWNRTHERTLQWVQRSAEAGRPWVVANDEQNPAGLGVPPDEGYQGFGGFAGEGEDRYDRHDIRKYTLWGNLMAGGAGVEYYFGYRLAENDLLAQDLRSRDASWDYCRIAIDFLQAEKMPLTQMHPADRLVGTEPGTNGNWCLAQENRVYLVYLPKGGDVNLDLTKAKGRFNVSWFNPREGGKPRRASSVNGGKSVRLSAPDTEDWAVLIRK